MGLGEFIWFEIVSHDPEGVERFYKNIIGWTPRTESSTGGTPYTLFLAGDIPVAGVSAASPPDDSLSHWFGYVHTENLDETAEQVESLGGEVHDGPLEVAGFGRFYVVGDPSGVVFALFDPESPSDFTGVNGESAGQFDWKELYADDLEETLSFYEALFDWKRGPIHDMEAGRYQIVVRDGEEIGGVTEIHESERGGPVPHWNYYIHVQDVDASAAAIESNDGTLLSGPMEVPGGDRVVIFRDPTGAVASLTSS